MILGDIMTITRMRMDIDGKGVTTLVTLFDCPLHCAYCINDFCHENSPLYPEGIVHEKFTPEELLEIVEKDSIYFIMSGGGITFGGGEPLLQAKFIRKFCEIADKQWNIRIETSLNVDWNKVEQLILYINNWIIDIKDWDKEIYKKYTGVNNDNVVVNLDNLVKIVGKERVHIKVPLIPGYQKDDSVDYSVQQIIERYGIEPEVFEYIVE